MGLKEINEFSAEEVGLWLTAQGLGEKAPAFVDEGVDGDLLLSLSIDDLKNDLGLSGLQSKKVMKNIEFSKNLTTASEGGGEGGEEVEQLKEDIKNLTAAKEALEQKVHDQDVAMMVKDDEIAELKGQVESMSVPVVVEAEPEPEPEPEPVAAPAPPPEPKRSPAPAPAPAPSHHGRRGPGPVGGAARGAAGGAVKGAIFGAIVPGMDAGDGAAAGAAVGAFSGGMGGIRGRRRGRR